MPPRAVLPSGYHPVAIDYHIEWKALRLEQCGKVGVIVEHDSAGTRIFLKIFPHRLFGFGNIHGKYNQSLRGQFLLNIVQQRLFTAAVRTPCRPELQQHNLSSYGLVVEEFAAKGFRSEARGRLALA